MNIALVTSTEAVLFILAWTEGLLEPTPPRRAALINLVPQALPAVVFLASVPLAYLWSPAAAHLSWASLVFLSPAVGAWARRTANTSQDD